MATKRWPRKARHIVCPLYGTDMYLIQDQRTWERVFDYLDATNGPPARGLAVFLQHTKTGEKIILIGVFDGQLDTLVHECGHAAFWILDHVGVKLQSGKANESYCYLLQTLVQLCLTRLETP